jgi:large subunit ribosomal protein L25
MTEISLKLDKRTLEGKHVRELRDAGLVPSVVYGGTGKPYSTQSTLVDATKVARAAGKHTPVHLEIEGKSKLAIIKSIDTDPVRRTLRHIAFHTIRQNEKIVTEVPIILTGQSESLAERAGLVVLQAIEKIDVRAIPAHLPESIELSLQSLATTDDKLTVADIVLPKGVEFADADQDMELVIANTYEPGALQAHNEAMGGDAESVDDVAVENGTETGADSNA